MYYSSFKIVGPVECSVSLHFTVLCPHRYSLEDEPSNLDEMPLMMSEEGFENDESDYQTLPRARVNQRQRGLGWFLLGGWKVLCGRYFYTITLSLLFFFSFCFLQHNDRLMLVIWVMMTQRNDAPITFWSYEAGPFPFSSVQLLLEKNYWNHF